MDIAQLLSSDRIGLPEAVARIVMSFVVCGLIGLEREMGRQSAGLRTHTLIGLGSTLLMLLSIWLPQHYLQGGDPGRIAAQVVSGIGFLGAGAFLKIGNNVKGLTTAASIWFVAGMGLCIGAGMWEISLVALAAALITLVLLERAERRFFPAERYKLLQIWYEGPMPSRASLEATLAKHAIPLQSFDATVELEEKEARLSMLVKVPQDIDLERIFADLRKTGKATKIRLQENY